MLRWFWASLTPFQAVFAWCGSLASLVGLYCLAYPSGVDGSMLAFVVFIISTGLLIVAWAMGILVAPWHMSVQETEKAKLQSIIAEQRSTISRMVETIRGTVDELTNVCNQINVYKGTEKIPYPNPYQPLNAAQDQIQKSVIAKLKSLIFLPVESTRGKG